MATEIGTRIKRARERKRWSQQQLAGALGVDRKTVDNWENGRTKPRSSIGALEAVLGVRLDAEPEQPGISDKLRGQIEAEAGDLAPEMIAAVERILARERGEEGPSSGQGPVRRVG